MARNHQPNNHGFNAATLFQVVLIPFVTGGIILAGFYYTTGDTLKRHDKELELLTTNAKVESGAREKVRDEFLISQQKIGDNIAKLDTRLAVSETKQETANQTLQKIADELSKISAITVRAR